MDLHDSEGRLMAGNGEIIIPVHHVDMDIKFNAVPSSVSDETKKRQEQKITIHGKIEDSALPAVQAMIRLVMEEAQRQQKLQAALEKSHVAHLDGYKPYLN